jgi:predicted DNA-binding protein (MmcQ/YjbR family)
MPPIQGTFRDPLRSSRAMPPPPGVHAAHVGRTLLSALPSAEQNRALRTQKEARVSIAEGRSFLCVLGVLGGKLIPMNVDTIRGYCLSFPHAVEKLQWDDSLCFKVGKKVGGKIFTIVGLDDLRVCFKCTPETFAELIEREDIRPAPYVGRYKWVMLDRLDALRNDELKELIRQSYEMVAARVPGKKSGKRKASTKNSAPNKKKKTA